MEKPSWLANLQARRRRSPSSENLSLGTPIALITPRFKSFLPSKISVTFPLVASRAIASVGYVLVCLSPAALQSDWVRREIAWTLEHAKHLGLDEDDDFVLPARIEPFETPDELKFLDEKYYADIAADFETGIQEIIAAVLR